MDRLINSMYHTSEGDEKSPSCNFACLYKNFTAVLNVNIQMYRTIGQILNYEELSLKIP